MYIIFHISYIIFNILYMIYSYVNMIYISLFSLIHPSQQRGEYGVKPTYRRNLLMVYTVYKCGKPYDKMDG